MSCCKSRSRSSVGVTPGLKRIDASGDEVWVSDCLDVVWDLAIDGSGNIWAAGSRGYDYQQFSDLNDHTFRRYNDRKSLCKVSPDGHLLDEWDFGSECFCVTMNENGVLVGNVKGTNASSYGFGVASGITNPSTHTVQVTLDSVSGFTIPYSYTSAELLAGLNGHPDIASGRYLPFQVSGSTVTNPDPKLARTDRLYPLFRCESFSRDSQSQPLEWSLNISPIEPTGAEFGRIFESTNLSDFTRLNGIGNSRSFQTVFSFSPDGELATTAVLPDLSEQKFIANPSQNPSIPAVYRRVDPATFGTDWVRNQFFSTRAIVAVELASFGYWYVVSGTHISTGLDRDLIVAYIEDDDEHQDLPLDSSSSVRTHSDDSIKGIYHTKPYFAVVNDVAYLPMSSNRIRGYEYDADAGVSGSPVDVFASDQQTGIAGMVPYGSGLAVVVNENQVKTLNLSTGAFSNLGSYPGSAIRCLSTIPGSTEMLLGGAYL